MLLLIIRTAILYAVTMLSMRLMGKRQIGQLQPFELVVVLIISEMATIGVQSNGLPLLNSLLPIIIITILQIAISVLNLKSERLRLIICGRPVFIIRGGEILEDEMRRLRLNINDLLEQLRSQGFFDVAEVEYAIMETNGQLSIMPRADKRPLQPADINLNVPLDAPAVSLIIDGHIQHHHLQTTGHDLHWLEKKLRKYSIPAATDVFFLSVDAGGHIFCQLKSRTDDSPAPIREGADSAPTGSGRGCPETNAH